MVRSIARTCHTRYFRQAVGWQEWLNLSHIRYTHFVCVDKSFSISILFPAIYCTISGVMPFWVTILIYLRDKSCFRNLWTAIKIRNTQNMSKPSRSIACVSFRCNVEDASVCACVCARSWQHSQSFKLP